MFQYSVQRLKCQVESLALMDDLGVRVPDVLITAGGTELHYGTHLLPDRSWERQKKKDIGDFMANAKELLVNYGFAETSVDTRIQNRKKGIARDIVKEAEGGYGAVVLRRRVSTGRLVARLAENCRQ